MANSVVRFCARLILPIVEEITRQIRIRRLEKDGDSTRSRIISKVRKPAYSDEFIAAGMPENNNCNFFDADKFKQDHP